MTDSLQNDGQPNQPTTEPTFPQPRVTAADVDVQRFDDGTVRARSRHTLPPFPEKLTERLDHWAATTPTRTLFARRNRHNAWQHLTYADARQRARHVAQALIDRGLSAERTVLILSGNSLEHAIVALGAMYAGVPYAPIAPAYSLMVREYTTLQTLVRTMRPGLIFASDGPAFESALAAIATPDIEIVTDTPLATLHTTPLEPLEATPVTSAVDLAHERVSADTIAKVLFTSGSTGRPKGVINTQRMLCANQEQILGSLMSQIDQPPVLCDWLPWNHTFGGNHNVGIALYNGGTLYIDDGRPVPAQIGTTVRNLQDVAPTAYFNVPKGFEMLLPHLRADSELQRHFFSELRLMFVAAAGLRADVADEYQRMAIATLGRPVPWVTGFGATETAPAVLFTGPLLSTTTQVGLPVVGLELKAVPCNGRLEMRVKGPNITPGYWRDEALTRASFDDEGFYRMGDAIAPPDPSDVSQGFTFEGRLSEDFKLSTGTWVRVGALRARVLAIAGDLIQDIVVAGPDRDDVRVLLFPNMSACRTLVHAEKDVSAQDVLLDARVRAAITDRLTRYNTANAASSTAIRCAVLIDTPPSIDAMEITDKGSLNQRAVLQHRASVVTTLYDSDASTVLL